MCPQASTTERAAEPSLGAALCCERIAAGPRAALIRVTLGAGAASVDGAQLVVVDKGKIARRDPLPSPVSGARSQVTLGFAVTRTATVLALVLGERWIALADTESRREVERELDETRARLKEARGAYASIATARREAVRAAARAEVAAHDATARAEDLERRLAPAGHRGWRVALGGRDRSTPRPATERGSDRPRRLGHDEPAQRRHGLPGEPAPARRRPGRRIVVAACALGPAAALAAILAWPASNGRDHGVGGVPSASASADRQRVAAPPINALAVRLQIPSDYLVLYRKAAARYGLDWTRLAAVGAIESGHGRAQAAGVVTGASADGASGPAQFLAGTWERYGLDGNADGRRSAHDPADAIPAMASYLRASGAPQDWRAALRSYNHSDAYVDAVEKLAASIRAHVS